MLDIVLDDLKKVAMDFYQISKMKIVLYDENRNVLYSYPDGMCEFCKTIRSHQELAKKCIECDNVGFDICEKTGLPHIYRCHMNLTEAIAPIIENGFIIGYLMLGQVLIDDDFDDVLERILHTSQKYNIDKRQLFDELSRIQPTSNASIQSAVNMLSMCACYLYVNKIIRNKVDVIAYQLKDYVDSHLADDLSISKICNLFYLSKSKLYNISLKAFGMGISDYIRIKRINEAKRLLETTSKSISQIADEVGISDANYFIRVFKKSEKITPNRYKAKVTSDN